MSTGTLTPRTSSQDSTISQGSSGSNGSRRKYRTVNKDSAVDESLFGKPPKKKEPEVIQVITKDMIRKLRIPREDPSGDTLVVSQNKFGRIRRASRVLTKREKEALETNIKKEKEDIQDAVAKRKDFMQEMELKRVQNEKLSEMEQEAKEKSQYLLQKAQEQVEEQEDEIKKLNTAILNAKCHSIRDQQLVEKS